METAMSRVQLALSVSDIDAAVEFYAKLFGTQPNKRRAGYANFTVSDPPLKLVLIETADDRGHGTTTALNHLGIEVGTADEVKAATIRLSTEGLSTASEEATSCCYALQNKVWVEDPDGAPWEIYTVLADDPNAASDTLVLADGNVLCAPETSASVEPAPCR
jgi:catechol 2,3-dioxygenase-like lactoylglutathione lyase family enzyme